MKLLAHGRLKTLDCDVGKFIIIFDAAASDVVDRDEENAYADGHFHVTMKHPIKLVVTF